MGPERFAVAFATEAEYLDRLVNLRWPRGIACIYCTYPGISHTAANHATRKNEVPVASRRLYQCGNRECRRQFSATAGTLFHKTHVPLSKWFRAITLLSTRPVTSHALQVELGVSYQTAWYLRKRIQEALRAGEEFLPQFVQD